MARPSRASGTRHLVLLGLPGAGKSTIGPLVADALGRPYVDLDAALVAEEGESVAGIFARRGEAGFRALEAALTQRLLASARQPIVLSPGGGWIERAENRAWLGVTADAVYLRVPVDVALRRMGPTVETRPLLAGPDPAEILQELLRRREPLYLQSRYTVSNESMTAEETASSIVALATAEIRD